MIYLPEIKYRRILNRAFGPGGWALMPRGETMHFQVSPELVVCTQRRYEAVDLCQLVANEGYVVAE